MNKADCPPKAIALAAGELVLRIREEKRRREVGGIAAEPAPPTKRMCGGKPGTACILSLAWHQLLFYKEKQSCSKADAACTHSLA